MQERREEKGRKSRSSRPTSVVARTGVFYCDEAGSLTEQMVCFFSSEVHLLFRSSTASMAPISASKTEASR